MFGKKVITKCPYCGTIYFQTLGGVNYYDYEDKSVRIEVHCDKAFITTDTTANINLNRYLIPYYIRNTFLNDTISAVYENFTEDMSEEQLKTLVFNSLEKKHSIEEINHSRSDINIIIEIIVGQMAVETLYSEPLTDEIKNKLKHSVTVCW